MSEVDSPYAQDKHELLEYMKSPTVTNARNSMGCSENWYNSLYSVSQTFSMEEVEAMSEQEVSNLLKLANMIAEGLY